MRWAATADGDTSEAEGDKATRKGGAAGFQVSILPPVTAVASWPSISELAPAASHSDSVDVPGATLGGICTCSHDGLRCGAHG